MYSWPVECDLYFRLDNFFSNPGPLISAYLYTRTQSIQKQIEHDVKSKYPEEYSTVDLKGSGKRLGSKSYFV